MSLFFFFHATATTEIYTLSLHDALPIWSRVVPRHGHDRLLSDQKLAGGLGILELRAVLEPGRRTGVKEISSRSEEHTSELQSQSNLVCRLLLEKKKKKINNNKNVNINTR